jgi:hypothetical protein
MLSNAGRAVLSLLLLYFVYTETGWATALALTLIFISTEIQNYTINNIVSLIKIMKDRFIV